ncbi:flagellar hook basal-body protein [Stakelama sp. CBK3Z-3]|uniref:Flagellar hook basal-body protein n=1 Tax=Stakelama flava TaxID=2860338 RepID=A0ABS6XJS7_9SPHN|nr:flagellar hook basal-body protein [Stakelama flava]MBW4330455.1 flagellar hook basal-body protein [Stakelama flava]
MDITSYVLLSHEQALRRRMDVVSNNMANLSTAGFKREDPLFREYVERTGNADAPTRTTSMVLDYGTVHDTSAGSFQVTDNPLDIMIDGPGYLSVETPEGGVAYTRAGYLKVAEDGTLTNAAGMRLLGEGGRPITVPVEDAGRLSIADDGTIKGPNGELGRVAVTMFDNEASVDPRGDGMFTGQGGRELTAAETRLRSGGIEGSNVQPIVETTNMVAILRAYQTSMRMAESMNDIRKSAIDKLGRFG